MRRLVAIVIAAIVVAIVFKTWSQPGIPRDDIYGIDGPATKAAVLNVIPVSSPIGFAKTTMEAKGFHCVMLYNQRHAGFDPSDPRRLITYPAADFLWCDSGDLWAGWTALVVTKRWQVSFVDKDGAVASVDVGVGLTGP